MAKEKSISSGFIIIITFIVIGIAGFFYMKENKFIGNSMTVTSIISDIKSEPRRSVLRVKTGDERVSTPILFVSIPSWDTRKIGEQIRVRVSSGTIPEVKVDEFIYLHKISVSILGGCLMLCGILLGVFFFGKNGGRS